MEFYTYIWRDTNGVPFYVGKGKAGRAFDVKRRSEQFKTKIEAGGCNVEIVDWFIHESQAHAHEVELIARYDRAAIEAWGLGNCYLNFPDKVEAA